MWGKILISLSGLEAVYAAEMGASGLALPALVLLGLRCEHLNSLGPLGCGDLKVFGKCAAGATTAT